MNEEPLFILLEENCRFMSQESSRLSRSLPFISVLSIRLLGARVWSLTKQNQYVLRLLLHGFPQGFWALTKLCKGFSQRFVLYNCSLLSRNPRRSKTDTVSFSLRAGGRGKNAALFLLAALSAAISQYAHPLRRSPHSSLPVRAALRAGLSR